LRAFKIQIFSPGEFRTEFISADSFSIGRSIKADICLDLHGISRIHLKVYLEDDQIFIVDKGSANGSFVREIQIPNNKPYKYLGGDHIKLGIEKEIIRIESLSESNDSRFALLEAQKSYAILKTQSEQFFGQREKEFEGQSRLKKAELENEISEMRLKAKEEVALIKSDGDELINETTNKAKVVSAKIVQESTVKKNKLESCLIELKKEVKAEEDKLKELKQESSIIQNDIIASKQTHEAIKGEVKEKRGEAISFSKNVAKEKAFLSIREDELNIKEKSVIVQNETLETQYKLKQSKIEQKIQERLSELHDLNQKLKEEAS
jgi:pSer/pThr/pTyr-binding forkhead associated (FHA) protein